MERTDTVHANLQADYVTGPLALSLQGDVFSTGGFPIVRADQRGAVDIDADSRHQTFLSRLEYTLTSQSSLFLAGSYFHEERGNGTPLQDNATEAGSVAAGSKLRTGDGSDWQLTVYAQIQTFGAGYQAFRAPTLNELYRQFRVQNIVTLANPSLGPERLTGGEIGLDYTILVDWLLTLTGFWNALQIPSPMSR